LVWVDRMIFISGVAIIIVNFTAKKRKKQDYKRCMYEFRQYSTYPNPLAESV
jgi:hypothetical protein